MTANLPLSVLPYLVATHTRFDGRIRSMPTYLLAVCLRMVAAIRVAPRARVVVAASHFFFDVVPAAVLRRRDQARVAAYVYHLVGESGRGGGLRNRVSIALESFSLAILRRVGDVVFVDNEATHTALLSRGFRAGQLVPTQNAYDPLEPLPGRHAEGGPSVLFIGRLVEVKGVWDVLALAQRLRREVPGARVAMLGDGPMRAELERTLAGPDAGGVELAGFVTEAEKWRRLRSASLFVFPSREEGWGIAVGEALIAGVPSLVYDLPAYRHFGELPVRVPIGDRAAFIRAAMELLTDPGRLDRARSKVEAGAGELPRWDAILGAELVQLGLTSTPSPVGQD
jgi:glycosyltransferase involved in cell wall biosynthesis